MNNDKNNKNNFEIQAVLFKKSKLKNNKNKNKIINNTLFDLNLKPIKKVHETETYYWYWITEPNYDLYKYFIKHNKNKLYDFIIFYK